MMNVAKYICILVHAHIYVYIYTYKHTYLREYTCMHIFIYTFVGWGEGVCQFRKTLKVFGHHSIEIGISNPGKRMVVCYYFVTFCECLA
jgi:hypothetical protein